MKWFGRSWGAIACRFEEHSPTPVGTACLRCDTPIELGDQGVIMPGPFDLAGFVVELPSGDAKTTVDAQTCAMHLECFLLSLHPCRGCYRCKPEKYPLH